MMKIFFLVVGLSLGLLFLLELGLRLGFGFGTPLLYVGDPQIGYLLKPNQRVKRFGNRIQVNEYSMRTAPISPQPLDSTRRIFLIGDSIVNGGWWTDQGQILSSLLEKQLNRDRATTQVINASANSWGPRNELAYLERFSCFGAETLVLVINTDDLFAVAPTAIPVGRDRNYPDRPPFSALTELLGRYLIRPKSDPILEQSRQEEGDRVERNLAAIAQIQAIAQANQAQFLLLMTPLKRELSVNGGPLDYEQKERQRLLAFVQAQEIRFVDVLPQFNQQIEQGKATGESLYRDHIHLSPAGNEIVVDLIRGKLS